MTQYATPTLVETQRRLRVSDQQLDREIDQLQFPELSGHIGDTTVFEIAFHLNADEKQQVNTLRLLKGNLAGTIEMFQIWKKKVGGSATYGNLLEIVYATVKDAVLGEEILKICKEVTTAGSEFPQVKSNISTREVSSAIESGVGASLAVPSGPSSSKLNMFKCAANILSNYDPDLGARLVRLGDNSASAQIRHSLLWGVTQLKVHFLNPEKLKEWNWTYGDDLITTSLILSWAGTWNQPGSDRNWPEISTEQGFGRNESQIRVLFDQTQGVRSRSTVGRAANEVMDRSKPTMILNLSGCSYSQQLQRSTVIHEFGHALGLDHEHQRSCFWDVLDTKDKDGKPRFIYDIDQLQAGEAIGDNNEVICFNKMDKEHLRLSVNNEDCTGLDYDSDSIMHYWFDKEWLRPQYQAQCTEQLTDLERKVIQGAIDRDFNNGELAKDPSKLDFDTLKAAYNKIPSAYKSSTSISSQSVQLPAPPTLKEIQQNIGVTDDQLDQEINSQQFPEIAELISDRAVLENGFNLDENEKQQVRSNGDTIEEMLVVWKNKLGSDATYRELAEIVFSQENAKMGQSILDMCKKSTLQPAPKVNTD